MAELLSTLPGDIPGLLRYTSPVRDQRDLPGLVFEVRGPFATVGYEILGSLPVQLEGLRLDLTDATGRAHAAWWATTCENDFGRVIESMPGGLCVTRYAYDSALGGDPMTPAQIDTLARLCLRLAGRSHV